MIYYTSDFHFNHVNCIKMCNRPYNTIEEMNEDLIKRFNAKVTDKDEVYILGDLGLKISNEDLCKMISRLNGKKHLIIGNHDKNTAVKELVDKHIVIDAFSYKEIRDNGRDVVLCHYPFETWNGMYHGSYHLYGHVHQNVDMLLKIPNRFHVGVDTNNFEPVTLDELITRSNYESN